MLPTAWFTALIVVSRLVSTVAALAGVRMSSVRFRVLIVPPSDMFCSDRVMA